jgi:hypothetical protein
VSTLYALLVGIDRYRSPAVPALAGCANDVADARALLEHRRAPGTDLHVRRLLNDEATRCAIIAGFRSHLARARAGDTALFWFSGHGSTAPVPDALWHLEPTGHLQTLVCADSRTDDRPDLLDKELAVLLDEVAGRGAHVVAVLDCCHAGGASRFPEDLRVRTTAPRPLPAEGSLLPGLWQRYHQSSPEPRALTLAACRATEQARERRLDGLDRGLFSWSLTAALRRCPPATTYRDLLAVARGEVERWSVAQRPELIPTGPGPADQPFLGGRIAPAAGLTMREGRDGWEVNAGLCHGVPAVAGDPARFAMDGPPPVREAEARRVLTGRTVVTPLGWAPDPGRTYRAVLSRVPAPATTVALDDDIPALPARPSAHIRFVCAAEPAELRVRPLADGALGILDADGRPLHRETDPRRVVAALEHIARWRQVRDLRNPLSRLAGAVSVELVEPHPGEATAPADRPGLTPDADGGFELRYCPAPPEVFIRLHNRSSRPLYCALLDLTDTFRIHAGLFPGAVIAPGRAGAALDGRPVAFSLPAGRDPAPGRSARDWLVLIVAEDEFDARAFELPRLGGPPPNRDTRPAARWGAHEWSATVIPVVTAVLP